MLTYKNLKTAQTSVATETEQSVRQTMTEEEKRYDPNDTTFKFVHRQDEITGDDDDDILKAEMSCGHAVTPQSLTTWCRTLLDEDKYKFKCPAPKDGKHCDAVWPYSEVRRMALLTQKEQIHFEETMAVLAAAEYCEYNSCPGCKSIVKREDLTNLCVECIICEADTGTTYNFCWQCLKKWKGPAPRSDRCGNDGCKNLKLENLLECSEINLPEVKNIKVPFLRACPTCGNVVGHDGTGCKHIICNRCHIEFCFSCLKLTAVCKSHNRPCTGEVAPRQTSIPVWKKKQSAK